MRRLVALDIPPTPAFLEALERCHEAGDAVLPIDDRLADNAKRRLLDALGAHAVLDEDGVEHGLAGGRATEEGDAFVIATSGSTGDPKGVVLTHDAVAASARAVHDRIGLDPSRDAWLSCLPLAHVGGLSVLIRARLAGIPLQIHRRFDATATLDAAARGATLVSLVPTTLRRLGPQAARFRTIVLGGSAPPPQRASNVVATYGLTETGSGVVYDGWPLDGVEIRVVEGEIWLRCPMLLRAYRDGLDPRDAAGWFHTGDGGSLDETGKLSVHGRLGDLVVTGGENVWPAAVEAVLAKVAGVAEVAVCGEDDPEWGERVVAYVVLEQGASVRLEELREPVADALGPWAAPKALYLVEALARTALGKIKRHELDAAPGATR